MKTALIMEGGAMRGMFTCGVLDVLLENHITFDAAAGISAGAVFGCNYKSRQVGRVIRYNKRYIHDPRYMSVASLMMTGNLFNEKFCYHTLPEELDPFDYETYQKNPMEFYVGATELSTGKLECHRCDTGTGEDMEWMRASASMPVCSRPVEIQGKKYLDGGIVTPLPYEFMESLGYHKNLVILTQPKEFRKEKMKMQAVIRASLYNYPNVISDLEIRHIKYNSCIEYVRQKESEGEALVLCPPEDLGIHRTEKNVKELERVYETGRQTAWNQLEDIREFLKKE